MGGPDRLEGVRPFLFNLFNDPAILRVPQPFRIIIATLISVLRAKRAKAIYQKMGGKSPLLENTQKQATALQNTLGADYRCFVGMSYSRPFIHEAVKEAVALRPEQIVLLPLYPQYSTTTTASALRDSMKALRQTGYDGHVSSVEYFYHLPGYIEVIAERTREALNEVKEKGLPRLLFSAHGLPERIIKQGDPYLNHCKRTVELILQQLGEQVDSCLCFQSRLGPVRWVAPFTDDEIVKAAKEHRPIVVVPIAFVCEHAETLVELAQEGRDLADRYGATAYRTVQTVGNNPLFIQGLSSLVPRH
jgi:ferrochelatase